MRGKPEQLVDAFAKAVGELAFIGTIPLTSDDPEEQQAMDRERHRLKSNYTKTRNRLCNALGVFK